MNFYKNQILKTEITDLSADGMGIGRAEGFAFFVSSTVPGDIIKMRVVKLKKNYGYGIIEELIKPSPLRREPDCKAFPRCGGCSLRHIDYSAQLDFKKNLLINNIERIGGLSDYEPPKDTVGMDSPFHYRNKGQYPVGTQNGKTVVGFYAKRSHRIIPLDDSCLIAQKTDKKILDIITEFMDKYRIKPYDEKSEKGIVRHILIKTAVRTGEIMVCIVINSAELPHSDRLIPLLKEVGVTTAVLNINNKKTNVILGSKNKTLFGKGFITDFIGDLSFRISPLSFFQVNPTQTEKLYNIVLELAKLKGNETVFDAYCGIGTISLFLAQKAGIVYGVEIVSQAIKDATENAAENGIENVRFITGASEEVYPKLYSEGIIPNLIVVDPPRKGCDPVLLRSFLQMSPPKIIYVSCNPSTLSRDIKILSSTYRPQALVPVDMFPYTTGLETVCLLTLKQPEKCDI